MKKISVLLLLISFVGYIDLFAQKNKSNSLNNQLGISIPVIWNNSEATFYQLGSPKYSSGNAISHGINLNYSRDVYKNFFGIIGMGYFKQLFNIKRPFDYKTSDGTKPLVYTKYYFYNNIYWLVGVGYQREFSKNFYIKGTISYNSYSSYSQRYAQEYSPGINEIYKKSLSIGSSINLNMVVEKNITNRISVGPGVVLPIYTKWNNDEIFIKNYYSSEEQQIARNKLSVGIVVSCNYHF